MELLRIAQPSFLPDGTILSKTKSFIWAEKYVEHSDFEVVVKEDIALVRSQFPEGTLVTEMESDEIMMVLTNRIKKNEKGDPELTLSGKSVTHFLSHRNLVGTTEKKYRMLKAYTAAEAAAVVVWNVLVNATGQDITRPSPQSHDNKNAVPNSVVTNSTRVAGTDTRRMIVPGNAWDENARRFLNGGKLGLRVLRPPNPGGAQRKVVTVLTAGTARGEYVQTFTNNVASLCFDIYDGFNRTPTGDDPDFPVTFRDDIGDFDQPEYLSSIENFSTIALVRTSEGNMELDRNATERAYTGFSRRETFVEAGSPDTGETVPDFLESAAEMGDDVLVRNKQIKIVDTKIENNAQYIFGIDYYLGDRVLLQGDYDFDQEMIVAEYIRSQDEQGVLSGYPTLVLPS